MILISYMYGMQVGVLFVRAGIRLLHVALRWCDRQTDSAVYTCVVEHARVSGTFMR